MVKEDFGGGGEDIEREKSPVRYAIGKFSELGFSICSLLEQNRIYQSNVYLNKLNLCQLLK
jgi:hypothetical protein